MLSSDLYPSLWSLVQTRFHCDFLQHKPLGTVTGNERSILFYEYGSGNPAPSKQSQLHCRSGYTLHFINPISNPEMHAERSSPGEGDSSDPTVCQGDAE